MKKLYPVIFLVISHSVYAQENRTADGTGNNTVHPEWGAANSMLKRFTDIAYGGNGYSDPGGTNRPNSRSVSNSIFAQEEFIGNNDNLSDFLWGFGQFIDHDITFNLDTTSELMEIQIPSGDLFFDPNNTGTQKIMMRRGAYNMATGTSMANPRQQLNSITGFVDGSTVYGSDASRAAWLRTGVGGKLKTSTGDLLPFNTTTGEYSAPVDPTAPWMIIEGGATKYFIAGDVRANEQPGLTCFHTLFLREHNRWCDVLAQLNPQWDDETLYQAARKRVSALIEVVLYEEFLPAFGIELSGYTGYDANIDPSIMQIFSSAAYRVGHTLVNDQLIRLEENGDTLSFGSIHIKEAFFNPTIIKDEGGIEPFFRGMATQLQQEFDNKVVGTLRNFLFGLPGQGGLDLVALNIERSRERGVPDFNKVRANFGLTSYTNFSQFNSDQNINASLQSMYSDINDIDPWVGMLSETPFGNSIAGETMTTIMASQFEALRDGDRFYYENDPAFTSQEIAELKATRLSDIIRRNTDIEKIQDDVFHADAPFLTVGILPFENIRKIDLIAYPNPTPDHFNLRVKAIKNDEAILIVNDPSGRIVLQERLELIAGENEFKYELDRKFSPGLYVITLQTSLGSGQLKLVKNN